MQSQQLDLPELAPLVGQDVEIIVTPVPVDFRPPRKAGSGKGTIWMSDDFDEPLEEFREYME